MRGDSASIENVQEVGRLLRLEKLKADFNRAIVSLAVAILAVIVIYIIVTARYPIQNFSHQNFIMMIISVTLESLSPYAGISVKPPYRCD